MTLDTAIRKVSATRPTVAAVRDVFKEYGTISDEGITGVVNDRMWRAKTGHTRSGRRYRYWSLDVIRHARLALFLAGFVGKVVHQRKPTKNGGLAAVWYWK